MPQNAWSLRWALLPVVLSLAFAAASCSDADEATPIIVDSSQATVSSPAAESSTTAASTTSSAPDSVETTSTVAPTATATATTIATCSAAGMPIPPAQDDLPGPVAGMRSETLAAATACDFDRLNELAVAGDIPFAHTSVLAEEYLKMAPGEFWRVIESQDPGILADLVHDLSQPVEIVQDERLGVLYQWRDPALCSWVDDIQLCRWVKITESGDWIAFYRQSM
jgi:hypothetical protein